MRKQDIAMIILIAGVSILISYFVMQAIFGNPSEKSAKVQTMTEISKDIVQPSSEIFNKNALNPTVKITVGEDGGKIISEN